MGAPIIFSSSVAERVEGEREREGKTEKGRERSRNREGERGRRALKFLADFLNSC